MSQDVSISMRYDQVSKSRLSYKQVKEAKEELSWQNLAYITVEEAKEEWLSQLSKLTEKNYRSGMNFLIKHGLIKPTETLQAFSLRNQNKIIDTIKALDGVSECTRQARAACFISLTRYFSRRTDGMIRRAIPCKEKGSKTFYREHRKVKTNAMTQREWLAFLRELAKINQRDCLIAKLTLQGGKRINEALALTTDQIDFDKREITFNQSKTRGREETVITYPQYIMDELKVYLGGRSGHVFITRNCNPVYSTQLSFTFALAGERAKIGFKVTPHVLRASAVTYLKGAGFSDSDIKKITGHASDEMVQAYDKTSRAQNPTKVVNLV